MGASRYHRRGVVDKDNADGVKACRSAFVLDRLVAEHYEVNVSRDQIVSIILPPPRARIAEADGKGPGKRRGR